MKANILNLKAAQKHIFVNLETINLVTSKFRMLYHFTKKESLFDLPTNLQAFPTTFSVFYQNIFKKGGGTKQYYLEDVSKTRDSSASHDGNLDLNIRSGKDIVQTWKETEIKLDCVSSTGIHQSLTNFTNDLNQVPVRCVMKYSINEEFETKRFGISQAKKI